nr:MAG TPA: hypothetical protein [Bacteriophage sp.]
MYLITAALRRLSISGTDQLNLSSVQERYSSFLCLRMFK